MKVVIFRRHVFSRLLSLCILGHLKHIFLVELFKYYAEKQLSLMVIVVVSVFVGGKHIKSGMYYSRVGYQSG